MTPHEHLLPPGIIDIDGLMGGIVVGEFFSQPDRPLPISPAANGLLLELLNDPFALDELTPNEKVEAASFVWRLGAACGMANLVLRNASDVLAMDEVTGFYLPDGGMIAQELIKSDPELLRHLQDADQETFWRIVGCDCRSETDVTLLMEALFALTHTAYLPDDVLNNFRNCRDTTSTMDHQPVGWVIISGSEVTARMEQPDEREMELREASTRVVFGGFIAVHTAHLQDREVFQLAVADFSKRALVDARGFKYALEAATTLARFAEHEQGESSPTIKSFTSGLESFAAGLDIGSIPVGDLCEMIAAAHVIQERGAADLRAFIARGVEILSDFQALQEMVMDSVPEEITTAEYGIDEQTVEAAKWMETNRKVGNLLINLRGEPLSALSVQGILQSLRDEGYTDSAVREAIALIAGRLDPQERKNLTDILDQAIGDALKGLEPKSPLSQKEGLQVWSNDHRTLAGLGYFRSGREFLDTKINEYQEFMLGYLAHHDSLKKISPSDLRERALPWFGFVCQALWYNRYHYVDKARQDRLVHKTGEISSKIIQCSLDVDSTFPPALMQSLAALGRLHQWLHEPNVDPQVFVAQEPVYAILSRYKASAIKSDGEA